VAIVRRRRGVASVGSVARAAVELHRNRGSDLQRLSLARVRPGDAGTGARRLGLLLTEARVRAAGSHVRSGAGFGGERSACRWP
jgi:hypothetical protein